MTDDTSAARLMPAWQVAQYARWNAQYSAFYVIVFKERIQRYGIAATRRTIEEALEASCRYDAKHGGLSAIDVVRPRP